MSKIQIKAETKSKNSNHKFIGKGLKRGPKIIYYDGKIKTQIIIEDKISIIREGEYYIELNLQEKNNLEGKYQTAYGYLSLKSSNVHINKTANSLYLKYDLLVNDEFVDTFEYNLNFSLLNIS